jgi:hypothetical protein
MQHNKTFENFLDESASKPGDEMLLMGVLRGLRNDIKPDLSNLDAYIKDNKHDFRIGTNYSSTDDVMNAIVNLVGDTKELQNYTVPNNDVDPSEGSGRWTEDKVKNWVKQQMGKGFKFYGSYTYYADIAIILSKKKINFNSMEINKPLNPDTFWADYYENYIE